MLRISLSVFGVLAICTILSTFLDSCSTDLNEAARNVKYSTKSEAPKDCKELGEVSVGEVSLSSPFNALPNIESVKNAMRNKTNEMGGNFLVVDTINSVAVASNAATGAPGSTRFVGSGRAYQCP
jgi:hypothetical protein